MKHAYSYACLTGLIGGLCATSALASNPTVEEAIASRPDLSSFYQAMVNTGVDRELIDGAAYTVFAPTNEAFARIAPADYPCFYSAACRAEVADIVRNHFVAGEEHLRDIGTQKGGLYSIDNRFIPIGAPMRSGHVNKYSFGFTADGHNITSTSQLAGSMLYKIDGVIASERELAVFTYPAGEYASYYVPGYDYAYVPGQQVTTTTRRVLHDPTCVPGNCPAAVQESTTVTRTEPAPILVPMAGPAY